MQYILMQYALQHTIRIQRNMPMQNSDCSQIAGLTRKSLLQKTIKKSPETMRPEGSQAISNIET